ELRLKQALRHPEAVADVSGVTDGFPPVAVQRRDYKRLARTLYAADGPVQRLLRRAGYSPERIQSHLQDFAAQRGQVLQLGQWLASPASAGMRRFWLGRIGDQWATLLVIEKVHDPVAFKAIVAHYAQAAVVDWRAQMARVLGHYRQLATWLLGGAYVIA